MEDIQLNVNKVNENGEDGGLLNIPNSNSLDIEKTCNERQLNVKINNKGQVTHELLNNFDNIIFEDKKDQRDQWTNKIEYMLSVIGYVVDLGSIQNYFVFKYKI